MFEDSSNYGSSVHGRYLKFASGKLVQLSYLSIFIRDVWNETWLFKNTIPAKIL